MRSRNMSSSDAKAPAAAASGGGDAIIRPEDLHRLSAEKAMAEMKKEEERKRKVEEERRQLHQVFLEREIHPDAKQRITAAVRRAAENGQNEFLALRFPSEDCTDGGRAINNFEPDWPKTLTGFAQRAYEFYERELRPLGYRLRAQILDYPGGVPGDVGIFLRW
jgi:hypothetical protein